MSLAENWAGRGRSPASQYRQVDLASRTEGATPHALVAMLYDELGTALDVMMRAGADDAPHRLHQHERAASILHRLSASLDPVGGGALAASLAGIYRQMGRRLLAGRQGDVAAIDEVRAGVASLAAAWAQIGV